MNHRYGSSHPEVLDILSSEPQFGIFRTAIAHAGLSCAFRTLEAVTVFAPTDAAFERLPADLQRELFDAGDTRRLAAMLWYHVTAGIRRLQQVGGYVGANTAHGQPVLISRVYGAVRVDGALVVMPDLHAGNGIVHGIDKVNLPRARPGEADGRQRGVPSPADGAQPEWKLAPWVPHRLDPAPRYGRRAQR